MGTVILNVSHTGYGDTERVCVGLGGLVGVGVGVGGRWQFIWYASRSKQKKDLKERYLLGQKHNMQIFAAILGIKLLNDT